MSSSRRCVGEGVAWLDACWIPAHGWRKQSDALVAWLTTAECRALNAHADAAATAALTGHQPAW